MTSSSHRARTRTSHKLWRKWIPRTKAELSPRTFCTFPREFPSPIVVFTPGYTGTFTDYTFVFEDLASRGYIVVSVAHTYESTAVELPGLGLVKGVFGSQLDVSWRGNEQTFSFAMSVRLQDLTFVLNELLNYSS